VAPAALLLALGCSDGHELTVPDGSRPEAGTSTIPDAETPADSALASEPRATDAGHERREGPTSKIDASTPLPARMHERRDPPSDAGAPVDGGGGTAPSPSTLSVPKLAFEDVELEGSPQAITDFAFIPGRDNEFVLLEKAGGVLHYELADLKARLLGRIDLNRVFHGQDCGLTSLTFDPGFRDNGYLFLGYCDSRDYSTVSRHVFKSGEYEELNTSRTRVLRVGEDNAPQPWHNIGALGFDSEGNLWAMFGEKDDAPQAQATDNLMGAAVRVRPRRGSDEEGYEVPADNPYIGDPMVRDEIVAYGLRMPWRAAIDRHDRLWIGDVGGDHEELNQIAAWGGDNFGWPDFNGPCDGDCGRVTSPLVSWDNSLETWASLDDPIAEPTKRRSIWVGLEYQAGADDPYEGGLDGKVLYGDFCGGWVRAIAMDDVGMVASDDHIGHLAEVTSMRQAPDGYVYASTYGSCFTKPYEQGAMHRAVLTR
ncbi:MAG: PQQ-dependent sugar dehydrogenase, partial [Myxococcales bacterium]|nr:PQQ-dependent sugar dehydrogenase [Myxococcales bacterium]